MTPRKLVVEFTKMNGAGNDFIVIDNRFYRFTDDELAGLARRFCPRRTGIGADGLLAFDPPREEGRHFRMRYRNADGSLGTMCGNGARCLVRFARWAGIEDEDMVFETDAGVYRAHLPSAPDAPVRLFVPPPRDIRPDVRLEAAPPHPVHYIWTGTEHLVCFVNAVAEAPVGTAGPVWRADPALAPNGANVNFVEVDAHADGRPRLLVRTYEKGVEAETLACGTGALAAGITARWLGYVDAGVVDVQMPGGVLTVGCEVNGTEVANVFLEGPAETVFRGTVEV